MKDTVRKTSRLMLAFVLVCAAARAEDTQRYEKTAVRLHGLSSMALSGCRLHSDVPHPEDPSLDDSSWPLLAPGQRLLAGVQVMRCWVQVPPNLAGYRIEGSTLKALFEFEGDGMTIITIYSNGFNLYHGDADLLEPVLLTADAHPGQRILVALRMDVGDQPRHMSRSEVLIRPSGDRPDPEVLRWEILSAQQLVDAYPDRERNRQLDAAVAAIRFDALDRGDNAAFDESLREAQRNLGELQPWLRHFEISAVGNSHIDMAWLWPWTETVEVARNTFRSALDMMQEYPDFKFAASSARVYRWIEEKYPAMFQEIQQRVKEGRWEIVGGMWIEPDLNMPGGESLTRQLLVGKQYFQEKFGVDVKVGWNPDSFGYSWQLPQIYKKSGIDYFVTQKLLWAHEFTTFPYKLFWWESPDGSKILTYFPHDYGSSIDPLTMSQDAATWIPSIYGTPARDPHPVMMYLYGVGDHGGGPTRTMLDMATQLRRPESVFPSVEFSTSGEFFTKLAPKLDELKVPTWNGELYFQYHRGVFTTQAETKKRVRSTEELLLEAETFASLASLHGFRYPKEKLEEGWEGLLFDDFHDILPGSGIATNYQDAKENLENVDRIAESVREAALEEISARIDTSQPGVPVVVYNPLAWERNEIVETAVQMPERVQAIAVADARGKPAATQIVGIDAETHRVRLLLQVHVPALGYATYFVRAVTRTPQPVEPGVKTTPTTLENELVRVEVDGHTGCIVSLFDKRSQKETLAPPKSDTGGVPGKVCGNLLQTFTDLPKEYDAWNIDADFEKQYRNLLDADEVKLSEEGPLRAAISVRRHFGNSTIQQRLVLRAGMPRLDIETSVEWHEKHILLKAAVPVSVDSDHATYEIPFGSIERPTTRNTPQEKAQFEVPALSWADLSDATHGLSLLNDSKYGYDAKANVLRLSLLRSPTWPDPHADEGHHEFAYSLYAHPGTWREGETVQRARELNEKLIVRQVQNHTGELAPSGSFVQGMPAHVILSAMKRAEDGSGLVLRFYEAAGQAGDVKLRVPAGARGAQLTNLMEEPQSEAAAVLAGDTLTAPIHPWEIVTVRIEY